MKLGKQVLVVSSIALALAGCSSAPQRTAKPTTPPYKGGGYYQDDGPGANPPANLAEVPDAVPRAEPPHRYANDPYTVNGKTYTPLPPDRSYKARGLASWYGRKYHGKATSTGEVYDMYGMTAAHATLSLPSYVRVTNPANGRSVVVRVNDRGPFHDDRVIDLSYTAAYKLDLLKGVGMVEVERLEPGAGPMLASAPVREASVSANPLEVAPTATSRPAARGPALGAGIYLQVGAFAQLAGAEELSGLLSRRFGRDLPGVLRVEAGGLHKVQVGPFANEADADRAADRLAEELGSRPFRLTVTPPSQTRTATGERRA